MCAAKQPSPWVSTPWWLSRRNIIYRLLDSQAVDVVLLDLKLPGAGGSEALHKIKQRRPDAEVVVVTGYVIVQSAVQAMKNGAYDYVTKPFTHRRTEASAEAGLQPT
jgi:two-component system NtrC family response regulator